MRVFDLIRPYKMGYCRKGVNTNALPVIDSYLNDFCWEN